VLAKSVTNSRIESNFQVFRLPDEDFATMQAISAKHPKRARVVSPGWGGLDVFEDKEE